MTHNPSAREMDMLLASGEQISIALLAMALNEDRLPRHQPDRLAGGFPHGPCLHQGPYHSSGDRADLPELERNRVVVVAGFQGLNKLDYITTLGRGGSDTSAVAIAAALHADRCQVFTGCRGRVYG